MLTRHEDITKTLKLAWPVILGQLSHIALGVIDTIMVGKLGVTPLAAAALANSYFVLPLTFCFGLASAIAPLTAKLYANKNEEKLKDLMFNGFLILSVFGLAFALLLIFSKGLLPYLNQPEQVITESLPYINYLAWSVIPMALYLNFKNFAEGFEWMMPALWIGVASIPLNTLLNYLLIYGHWGFPAYGLEGAGIATLITRSLMLFGLMYVMLQSHLRKYMIGIYHYNWTVLKKIMTIGIPSGSQYVFEAGAFVTAALLMGMLGEYELAAHQVAINIASIPFMASIGISVAASIRMGNLYGKKNFKQIRATGINIIYITTLMMIVTCSILAIGNRFFPAFYIENERVLFMASRMVIIAALFQFSDGLQAVIIGLLRGLEDVMWPTIYTIIAYWVISIPLGAYLAFKTEMGYIGVWIGLLLGLTISSLLMLFRFLALSKKKGNFKPL